MLKDLLVEVGTDARQGGLLAVLQFGAVGRELPILVVPLLHLLRRRDICTEECVHSLKSRRDRHKLLHAVPVGHAALDAVVERHPLGESLDVLPHTLELRVEQVRTVLGRSQPVLLHVVVTIAANVVSHVNHAGGHAELFRAALGNHSTREASTDNK